MTRVALLALVVFLSPAGTRAARQGLELLHAGNATGAEERFRAALAAEEDARVTGWADAWLRMAVHNNLGLTLLAQDDPAGAADAFDQAAAWSAIDTVTALVVYNAGTALARGDRWDPARDRLVRALILDPESEDARHNLEVVLRRLQGEDRPQPGRPPEPSAFARRLRADAERLVGERRYAEALALMEDGRRRDSTVAAFDDFIGRLGEVVGILSDTTGAPGR
jgi:tetratricopeptide (TPR) repeat protein